MMKFDLTDPQHCSRCDKFDPENDITIKGESNEVDSESTQSFSKADEESEDKEGKDGKKEENKGKEEDKEGIKVMDHARKLSILKKRFKDWLSYCDIALKPYEQVKLNMDDTD